MEGYEISEYTVLRIIVEIWRLAIVPAFLLGSKFLNLAIRTEGFQKASFVRFSNE